MIRFARLFRRAAAAALFVASATSFAASAPLNDETLAPLTAAYMRAVKPGEQVELYRELFATVLQRVQRVYAREVDMSALVGTALKTAQSFEPHSAEAAEVFKKSINAALATLDPHSRYLDARAQMNE